MTESDIPFPGIANPEELAILQTFHGDICRSAGIEPASPEGEDAARLVISVFKGGARTMDALKAGFDALNWQDERRLG